MNIDELIQASKAVPFELDGKKGTLQMQSPSGEDARRLRKQFYVVQGKYSKSQDEAVLADALEDFLPGLIRACAKPGEIDGNVTDESLQLFIHRIGFVNSEVVRYASEVSGIPLGGEQPADITQGDHADF